MIPIRKALLSVTDKTGLVELAKALIKSNPDITLIASGGTAKTLDEAGIMTTPISQYTCFPECFGGRVKTLHPTIAGGILQRRGIDDGRAEELGIAPIDMVVCNLYAFEKYTDRPFEELIEHMDIGGSTLIRAACKNYLSVACVTDPTDYRALIDELLANKGALSLETRKNLAAKAINTSADYEARLAENFTLHLTEEKTHRPKFSNGKKLRYGENPDQMASLFTNGKGLAAGKVLSGKELSYNNYEDGTVAYLAAQELIPYGIGAAVVKHGSLTGFATGKTCLQAFSRAWQGDSKSAFGSVIALNSFAQTDLIEQLATTFIEVLIAPKFADEIVSWAAKNKPNLRLIETENGQKPEILYKSVSGGVLIQTPKQSFFPFPLEQMLEKQIVTKKKAIGSMKGLFAFGVIAVNFAKSNAIAIVREYEPEFYQLIGMGAGQPNRIDSLMRLAIPKALENLRNEGAENPKEKLGSCLLCSDGFFPFDDSIKAAAEEGIRFIAQPGGSIRDDEIIKAADESGLCMLNTCSRYFSH